MIEYFFSDTEKYRLEKYSIIAVITTCNNL